MGAYIKECANSEGRLYEGIYVDMYKSNIGGPVILPIGSETAC